MSSKIGRIERWSGRTPSVLWVGFPFARGRKLGNYMRFRLPKIVL